MAVTIVENLFTGEEYSTDFSALFDRMSSMFWKLQDILRKTAFGMFLVL